MITKNELVERLGISEMTVRNRAKALELVEHYDTVNGTNIRVFTEPEAEAIENYRGKKPGWRKGRKRGKSDE